MEGKLRQVSKKVLECEGIFCGKFCVGRGQYLPCQRVWCGGCYVENPKDEFPKSGKRSGRNWEGELKGRYEKGRMRDHLHTHFQCYLFHS